MSKAYEKFTLIIMANIHLALTIIADTVTKLIIADTVTKLITACLYSSQINYCQFSIAELI